MALLISEHPRTEIDFEILKGQFVFLHASAFPVNGYSLLVQAPL